MKPVHLLWALLIGAVAALGTARAQVAIQPLTFVIFAQYEENRINTNNVTTNELRLIKTVEFNVNDLHKALALDYAGRNWTNFAGAVLCREVEFNNGLAGREGIFLYRNSPPTNLNVSANFGLNFSNNFTQNVTNVFPGVTNLAVNPMINGGVFPGNSTNIGSLVSDGLFSMTFYTTNLQFNLISYGHTTETNLTAAHAGNHYSGPVQSVHGMTGLGTFGLNISTNFFTNSIVGIPNTNFVSGPAHGYFNEGAPVFITNSADSVFGP
jgi:hypothetical protein